VPILSPIPLACLALAASFLASCQADGPGQALATSVGEQSVDQTQAMARPSSSPAAGDQAEVTGDATAPVDAGESEAQIAGNVPFEETPAGNADVEFVRAMQAADGTWRFDVTVRHPDTGWQDYADGWDVLTPDGQVLKAKESDPFTRLLVHPHENEQPFTRSQSRIVVPDGVTRLIVRAHDLVDGFGGREIEVDLTRDQGQGFEVSRQ
jgi:hypothetical protein